MTAELVVDLFVSVDRWAGGDSLPPFFGSGSDDLLAWTAAEKEVPERVVMGRRTYDAFAALSEEGWTDDREPLMRRDKVIFSPPPWTPSTGPIPVWRTT